MRSDERKRLVEEGYDRIAEQYLASKRALGPEATALFAALTAGLDREARILDLGCGAGVPATQWLTARGRTVGIDRSARQLALARREVPRASFVRADMGEIDFAPGSFAAVVSLYAIIHLPREEHPALLTRIARWLAPGGGFLATWPLGSWEGEERDWEGWGAPMWWSHHGAAETLTMLHDTGFTIARDETLTTVDETWRCILARRP